MQEQDPVPASSRGLTLSYKALAVVAGVIVIAAAIGVPLWQFVFTKSNTTAPSIHFHYPPKTWKLVKPSSVPGAPANASAVLQRKGNTAILVVLRGPAENFSTTAAMQQEANSLAASLKKKYSDYVAVKGGAKKLTLPHAGTALLFQYGRKTQGLIHTITIIPAGPISYLLETAEPPQHNAATKKIAEEIGAIIRSSTLS